MTPFSQSTLGSVDLCPVAQLHVGRGTASKEEVVMSTTEPNGTQTVESPQSKPKRAWVLIALAIVVGALLVGELAFQEARLRGWTIYTKDDGLASNDVSSVIVAPDGTVWVGTGEGVSSFDGDTWTTHRNPKGVYIHSIAAAPDGTLWFGSWSRIFRFDGETWTKYTEGWERETWSIAVAPDGALWVGTGGGGVSRFDGQTWDTYTRGPASIYIWTIAVGPDGVLWAGTDGRDVSRFDGQTWMTYGAEHHRLPCCRINAIAVEPGGAAWVGNYGGVSRFDGQTWTTYRPRDGLAGNQVYSIAADGDGVLWVGGRRDFLFDGGISRFDGQTWSPYTPPNLVRAGDGAHALAVDDQGRVWVGGGEGLGVFDERAGVPGQTLQVWSVLLKLSVAVLVLLAIVWMVRHEVQTRRSVVLAEWSTTEKRTARNWYWWLWLSPLAAVVPTLGLFVSYAFGGRPSKLEVILVAVVPAAFWYLVLLVPALNRRSEFVRWHGRQALLLAGVLTAMLPLFALELVAELDQGLTISIFAILSALWFFGTLLSQRQAARGDCSLMRWFGKGEALRRGGSR